MSNYAIILAGGTGSRFWPLSRNTEPKQFLSVCSKKPMIEETIRRISPLIRKENIYIATNKKHKKQISKCLKGLKIPQNNFLFEPSGRNTFPPIAVITKKLFANDPQAVISVLPCDHVIKKDKLFLKFLNQAIKAAQTNNIITFGITPKRPETGYGYIKTYTSASRVKGLYKVEKFVEKPDFKTAQKYVKDERFFWNSGIFIFKAKTFLEEIRRLYPGLYKKLILEKNFSKLWLSLPSTSIDYAVMEKTKNIAVLPADYGWLDLGSWKAIEEVHAKDKSGNIFKGENIDLGSQNSLIWGSKRLIATIGLKDIIIVDTQDALLVCHKDKTQDVKKIVEQLKKINLKAKL